MKLRETVKITLLLLSMIVAIAWSTRELLNSGETIEKDVLDSGGGISTNSEYTLLDAIGQSTAIGVSSNSAFTLEAGFFEQITGQRLTIKFGENNDDFIQNVTSDTYIRNGNDRVDFNYGSQKRLRVGYKIKGINDKGHINRSLIKFDFIKTLVDAGVASPIDILSATLKLTVEKGGGESQSVDVYRLLKDWGEGIHDHQFASRGEATWKSAQHNVLNWFFEGASHHINDREDGRAATQFVALTPNRTYEGI